MSESPKLTVANLTSSAAWRACLKRGHHNWRQVGSTISHTATTYDLACRDCGAELYGVHETDAAGYLGARSAAEAAQPTPRTIVAGPDSPEDLPRRLRACVESWPGCHSGGYDPRCCRFPKSCSPHAYPEAIAAHGESILEPADASVVTPPLSDLSQFELIVGEDDDGCAADLRCLRCPRGLTGWSAEVGGKTLAEIVTLAKHHEQEVHAE